MTYPRLFTTPAGSALWAPEVPGLMLRFHGPVSLAQYQQLMNTGLEMFSHQAQPGAKATWIADTRQLPALPEQAQQWTAIDWSARAYEAGLRHLRLVEPEYSSQSLTEQLHTATQQPAAEYRLQLSQHETLLGAITQAQKSVEVSSCEQEQAS